MKIMRLVLAGLLAFALAGAANAAMPNGSNGIGTIVRPANTTTYGSGAVTKLLTTVASGTGAPMVITIYDTVPGSNLITGARMVSTGTALSTAAFKIYLFTAPPQITNLSDGSTYVGPYGADMNGYVGVLTCNSFAPTNDASAQYWSECSIGNLINQTLRFPDVDSTPVTSVLYGTVEVTSGYVPVSQEQETLQLTTIKSE